MEVPPCGVIRGDARALRPFAREGSNKIQHAQPTAPPAAQLRSHHIPLVRREPASDRPDQPLDGLTAIVANDMKAIDQRFFLRLAELADAADDEARTAE